MMVFFALFPKGKLRRLGGSRVRTCSRTRARPRQVLLCGLKSNFGATTGRTGGTGLMELDEGAAGAVHLHEHRLGQGGFGVCGSGRGCSGMEEVHKYFEEKVMKDTGEDIILKNGKPAFNLYDDRTHTYFQSSGRCWLDWAKNPHRHVRRPLSAKTMKNLTCLLCDISSDPWLQLGRVNAVCGRNHRVIQLGQSSIDDDDEGLGDDDGRSSGGGVQDGGGGFFNACRICLFRLHFEHCTSLTRCSAGELGSRLAI